MFNRLSVLPAFKHFALECHILQSEYNGNPKYAIRAWANQHLCRLGLRSITILSSSEVYSLYYITRPASRYAFCMGALQKHFCICTIIAHTCSKRAVFFSPSKMKDQHWNFGMIYTDMLNSPIWTDTSRKLRPLPPLLRCSCFLSWCMENILSSMWNKMYSISALWADYLRISGSSAPSFIIHEYTWHMQCAEKNVAVKSCLQLYCVPY